MLKSVPYLAALVFSARLISLSAHADTQMPAAVAAAHDPRYANVSVFSDATANFRTPESLDVIWTAQNYHDLHDAFMGPADVAAL